MTPFFPFKIGVFFIFAMRKLIYFLRFVLFCIIPFHFIYLTVLLLNISLPVTKQLYARLGFAVEEAQIPYERMVWYPASVGIFSMGN